MLYITYKNFPTINLKHDMKNKIGKWNEVTYETMTDIFRRFLGMEDWTKDMVLEIQDPIALAKGDHERRMYLGNKIGIDGWDKYDEPYLDCIKVVTSMKGVDSSLMFDKDYIILCMLESKNPTIVPIFTSDEKMSKALLTAFFGDPSIDGSSFADLIDTSSPKWYTVENNERYVHLGADDYKKFSPEEKFIRIRTIDYETWKTNITEFLEKNEPLKYTDLDLENITLLD